jgi:phage shock protein C
MKQFYRSTTQFWLGGVFGGLGEMWEIDPNVIRLIALYAGLATGILPLLVTYVVAWLVIPKGGPVAY